MNTSRDSDLPQFKSCRNNQQHQEPLFASSYVPQCSQTSSELQHLQLDDGKVNDTEQYKDFKNSHVLSPCLHRQQEQQKIYSKLMQMHSLDQQRGPLKTPPVPARSRPTYTVKSQYQSVDSPASNFNTLTDSNGYIQNAGQSSGNMSTSYSQAQHLDNSPPLSDHLLKIIVTPNTVRVLSCRDTKDASSKSITAIISDLTARLATGHADCDTGFQSSSRLSSAETLARYLWSVKYHLLQEQALFHSPSSYGSPTHGQQLGLLLKFWQFFTTMSTTTALTCSLIEDYKLAAGCSSSAKNDATAASVNHVPFWLAAKRMLVQTGTAALGTQLRQDGVRALLHVIVAAPKDSHVPVEAMVIVHDGSVCKPALSYNGPYLTMANESSNGGGYVQPKTTTESVSGTSTKRQTGEEVPKSTGRDVAISTLPAEPLAIPPAPKVELMRRGGIHAARPRMMPSAPPLVAKPTSSITSTKSHSPKRNPNSSRTDGTDVMNRGNSSSLDCLFRDYLEAAQRFVEMPLVDSRKYTALNKEYQNDKSYNTPGPVMPVGTTTVATADTRNVYPKAKPEYYQNSRARNLDPERGVAHMLPESGITTSDTKDHNNAGVCDSYFSEVAPNMAFYIPPPVPEKDLKYQAVGARAPTPTLDGTPAHAATKASAARRFSIGPIETSHGSHRLPNCSEVSMSSVNLSKECSAEAQTCDTVTTEELGLQKTNPRIPTQILTPENIPETVIQQENSEYLSIQENSGKELSGHTNGDLDETRHVGETLDANASEESTHTSHYTFPETKSMCNSSEQGDVLASTRRRYRRGLRVWLREVFRPSDPDTCVSTPRDRADDAAPATSTGANDTSPSPSPSPLGHAFESLGAVATAHEKSSTGRLPEPQVQPDTTSLASPQESLASQSRTNLADTRAGRPLGQWPTAGAARMVNGAVPRPQTGSAMEHELFWRSARPPPPSRQPPLAVSRVEFRRLRTSTFEPTRLSNRSPSSSSSSYTSSSGGSLRSTSSNRAHWMRPAGPGPSAARATALASLPALSDNSDDDGVANGSAAAAHLAPDPRQHGQQELREYYNVPMFRTLSVISSENSPRSTLWIDDW